MKKNYLNSIHIEYRVLILITLLIVLTLFYNYLLFHTLGELFSIVIAFTLGIIILNTRKFSGNNFLTFMGIAYLFIAFMDLLHTLSYKGLNIIFVSNANIPTQFWISARYLEALSLLSAVYLIKRTVKLKVIIKYFSIVTLLLTVSIFIGFFPICYRPDTGLTAFKITSEYLIIGIFLLGIYFLYKNKKNLNQDLFRFIKYAYIFSIFAELSFTLYNDVYSLINAAGHIFKIYSFYFIYKAIIETTLKQPYDLLYYKLKNSRDKLIKTNQSLTENIKKQKKVEGELRKFSRAVEQNPSTIVITDPAGNIEYVNPKFTRITGYPRKDVVGKNPRILKSGLGTAEVYEDLWQTISSGNEWRGELCNKKKNGDLYWEFASISSIKDEEGNITHYIGIKEDITERKEIEKELKKAKLEAEQANQAKSTFLAKITHEIRTPMNGIIGLSELMLDMELDQKHRHYLKMINNSANLLLDTINDILDISKIEAGKMELEEKEFNIARLIEDTIQPFAIEAHEKNLELNYYIGPGVPDFLFSDSGRLRQILINLIGNAIKYTEKGEVFLEVKHIKAKDEKVEIIFQVTDTGIGIPVDKQEKLFRSFSQINNHRNIKNGSGLGLSICRQLVELLGGKIGVCSYPDFGSTFFFNIKTGKVTGQTAEKKEFFPGQNLKAYLVDFNFFRRKRLLDLLENQGIEVTTAKLSGNIHFIDYDVILLNTNLNQDTRKNILHGILNKPGAASKTILLQKTTDYRNPPEEELQQFGATIFKPEPANELFRAINMIINNENNGDKSTNQKIIEREKLPEKLKILIADDNHINRELIVNLLQKKGWEVTTARNGKDVLDIIETDDFDLILMDIQMPIMDGLKTTEIIRNRKNKIPIIALTAGIEDNHAKWLAAGMNDIVHKPVIAEELFTKISSSIKGIKEIHVNFDPAKLLARVDGHQAIARKVINSILNNYPSFLQKIETAIKNRDAGQLEFEAHSFKGAISNLGIDKVTETVYELEIMGKQWDLQEAPGKFKILLKMMEELKDQLKNIDFKKTGPDN